MDNVVTAVCFLFLQMFISSKLGQNLSEMDVKTFVRIQRVNWDHLLAFNAEIIQKQALYSFSR